MPNRVSVDLNGVLDMYDGRKGEDFWHEPRPGAARFLKELKDRGHEVVILTARSGPITKIVDWLAVHGLLQHVDEVTKTKLPSFAYIDDRAVCFRGDFDETLEHLDDFTAHWEDPDDQEWPGEGGPG